VRAKRPAAANNGHRTNAAGKRIGNKILLALPDSEYRKMRGHLEYLDLPSGFSLHEPHKKQRHVYFLNRGLASVVVSMRGGRDVEAGVIGCEGGVGTAIAVGVDRSPLRVMIQIRGNGFRISARALRSALESTPEFRMRLNRHAVLHGIQVAQTAACNRLHDTRSRLARWLLMAYDRVGDHSLHITHDFLATMLGTDRPSVSIAAAALQKENAIRYRRGSVEIIDRKKLEGAACECYKVVQQLNGILQLK
jgi:CRP-like cAMP-binding protein